jgi:hypothetical protein
MINKIKQSLEKVVNFVDKYKKEIGLTVGGIAIGAMNPAVNADRLKVNFTSPHNSGETWLYHVSGDDEGWDLDDSLYTTPTGASHVRLYSENLLIPEGPYNGRIQNDFRPLDSMSTYTCPIEGEGITDPNAPADISFDTNSGDYQGNNVIANFYKNTTPQDPNATWVHTGDTIDAKLAGDDPSTSYATLPVVNGKSHLMQVSYHIPEDVNFDGKVDMQDYAKVAVNWENTEQFPARTPTSPRDEPHLYADINDDGYVDLADVAQMSAYWLSSKDSYAIDCYDPINPDPTQCPE